MTQILIRNIFAFLAIVFMVSCSTVKLTPEGSQVRLIDEKNLSRSCKYIAKVSASDINGVTQSYQSHEHLHQDETNIMKNKAAQLGANALIVAKDKAIFPGDPKTHVIESHWMEGKAYQCML